MTPLSIAALAFACIAGAGLLGLALRADETHKAEPVRDMVRFTQGIVASISALVLGLLVAGATDHYRSQGEQVRRLAAETLVLDRALAQFDPEAADARRVTLPPGPNVLDAIVRLEAASPGQAFLKQQALDQVVTLARARATLATAEHGGAIQSQVVKLPRFRGRLAGRDQLFSAMAVAS